MPAKKYIVELSSQEREELTALVNKGKAAAYKRKHAEEWYSQYCGACVWCA